MYHFAEVEDFCWWHGIYHQKLNKRRTGEDLLVGLAWPRASTMYW